MMDLKIDVSGLLHAEKRFEAAAKAAPLAKARAINHTGDKARTAMRVALVDQTGLKRRTTNKALRSTRASIKGGGSYVIRAAGGNIRLQFFKARETRQGVSAAPWNKRTIVARSFMKGGRFPNRVPLNLKGAVLIRAGKGRYPVRTVKSGLFIAEEMVTGKSADAFFNTVQRDLPARITHELARIL